MNSLTDSFLTILFESFTESIEVSALVLLIMLLVELFNISTISNYFNKIHGKPILEILLSCALGAVPGCAGGFILVTMYSRNMLSLAALCAGMTATFGDEAIFLFTQNPKIAILLTTTLFILGVAIGITLHIISPQKYSIKSNLSDDICLNHYNENLTLKDKIVHFAKEHLWNHIIKEHALKIFLYIFLTLLTVGFLNLSVDIDSLLQNNSTALWLALLLAVSIGIMPISGPHLVFVVLFLQGSIPFSILLANSISQNGHAGIPLVEHSKNTFFIIKIITAIFGFLVGSIGLLVV